MEISSVKNSPSFLEDKKHKIEFSRHNLSEKDKTLVMEVLNSFFLTTGDIVYAFEQKFAKLISAKYAVGVTSCTAALELTLRYFNIGMDDEVITTPMSFVATSNVIEYVGAKPIFVDVEFPCGNIDASLIEDAITPKTKAILIVHLYGQMCDMIEIRRIADKHNLKVIEDSAHCIEGMRDGIRVGELSDAACFSFYVTKNLTSGEGGAISCNDQRMYEWLIKARQHGISRNIAYQSSSYSYEHYDLEFLGLKCNMSNISAAMMIHQIDELEECLNRKYMIASRYNSAFLKNPNIQLPTVHRNVFHAWHLYTILVKQQLRDIYLQKFYDSGICVDINYKPIHLMKYYKEKYGYVEGIFPNAEKIGSQTLSLPLYNKLTDEEIGYIISKVNEIVG